MWILKWILGAILIILILGFAFQNMYWLSEMHEIKIISWLSPEIPLYFIVFLSFAFGLFTWLIVSIFKVIQLKTDYRQLKKQNQLLQDELNKLRNLSVEEAVSSPEIEDESNELQKELL